MNRFPSASPTFKKYYPPFHLAGEAAREKRGRLKLRVQLWNSDQSLEIEIKRAGPLTKTLYHHLLCRYGLLSPTKMREG